MQHVWYNKDSNLRRPERVGDGSADAVGAYIRSGATSVQMQAFVVERMEPDSQQGSEHGGLGGG